MGNFPKVNLTKTTEHQLLTRLIADTVLTTNTRYLITEEFQDLTVTLPDASNLLVDEYIEIYLETGLRVTVAHAYGDWDVKLFGPNFTRSWGTLSRNVFMTREDSEGVMTWVNVGHPVANSYIESVVSQFTWNPIGGTDLVITNDDFPGTQEEITCVVGWEPNSTQLDLLNRANVLEESMDEEDFDSFWGENMPLSDALNAAVAVDEWPRSSGFSSPAEPAFNLIRIDTGGEWHRFNRFTVINKYPQGDLRIRGTDHSADPEIADCILSDTTVQQNRDYIKDSNVANSLILTLQRIDTHWMDVYKSATGWSYHND